MKYFEKLMPLYSIPTERDNKIDLLKAFEINMEDLVKKNLGKLDIPIVNLYDNSCIGIVKKILFYDNNQIICHSMFFSQMISEERLNLYKVAGCSIQAENEQHKIDALYLKPKNMKSIKSHIQLK